MKFLSEKQVPVTVKLRDGEQVHGWIEYFDDGMIRLTREGKSNLFIYKDQVRTISETARRNDLHRGGRAPARIPDSKEGLVDGPSIASASAAASGAKRAVPLPRGEQ